MVEIPNSRLSDSTNAPAKHAQGVTKADGAPDMVRTWGLTKRYGSTFTALDDCSLAVKRGEIFGLLGPNGAGKTTLIRLMLGFLRPSGGRSEIDGCDSVDESLEVRKRVAYLPGDARLPRMMRGAQVLKFFADLHPRGDRQRSVAIAERLELDTRRRVGFMSTGMRQKLALSVVFGLDTPLLILDEPTANLDPTIRGIVLDLVREARAEGRTVVFSSHVLGEIEETCGRVAFLRRGRLAHELTMSELFQRHRITGRLPGTCDSIEIPSSLQDRVQAVCENSDAQIDTAGDLGPLLSWVDSLGLNHVRIEPLGLRAVYDAVHFGHTSHVGSSVETPGGQR